MAALYPVTWAGAYLTTGENPRRQTRGMDFYYNLVDWVGGYPYEYASREEVLALVEPLGFACQRYLPTKGFTGCNEYLFRRE